MSVARKTVTITDQQASWISSQIEAGRYTNDSELIRDLIRREQERQAKTDAIRQALIVGEQSGQPTPFDFKQFVKRKLDEHHSAP